MGGGLAFGGRKSGLHEHIRIYNYPNDIALPFPGEALISAVSLENRFNLQLYINGQQSSAESPNYSETITSLIRQNCRYEFLRRKIPAISSARDTQDIAHTSYIARAPAKKIVLQTLKQKERKKLSRDS